MNKETIYSNTPRLIVPDLSDLVYRHSVKDENDRTLVHRITQTHLDQRYTVDYITTKISGVWHQYTVVYKEGSESPFPHTIDLRFEEVESAPVHQSSSSSFLASARAMMAKK